ncbi:gamma-secretase subunit Aph-1 [Radiomyces spectabilis]|uniref:gamma-secretase subunit Aph-1 n=1 Tax=Radiomyces spectabilis TaxID=64574 RepID=UPI0022207DF7|nr:gamma-secretase subunit Aph-1 [Radiomyces spectabilis]KAI8379418.1 gamma-secretase subunit Aph-1 [Radiomyces spectabilis]
MSLYSFFGCLLIAYGPILSIFFLYIARNARHVLLMVASAFFCLIALLLSSVIWYFAKATQFNHAVSIVYSITIQELLRWCFFRLLIRAEAGLNIVSVNPKSPFNRSMFAFVSGFGYALMTSLVSYISLLVESIGPGVIMCPSCPQVTVFFVSAITTTLFSLLHMAWMMIAFEGFANITRWRGVLQVIWVVASHYGASYATMMNGSSTIYLGCVYAIIVCMVLLSVSVMIVAKTLKSRLVVKLDLIR